MHYVWALSWISDCCNLICKCIKQPRVIVDNAETVPQSCLAFMEAGQQWVQFGSKLCSYKTEALNQITLNSSPKNGKFNMNKVSVSSEVIHQRHCWIGIYLDKTICIQTLLKDVHQVFCGLCYSIWPFWKFNLRLCCMEKYWNCTGVIESSHFMSLLCICVWKYEIPVFLMFQVENRQFKNKSNRLIFYCTYLWEKWYLSGAFYVSYTWVYINIFLFLSPASHFK